MINLLSLTIVHLILVIAYCFFGVEKMGYTAIVLLIIQVVFAIVGYNRSA